MAVTPDQFVFMALDDQADGKRLTFGYSAKVGAVWGQTRGRGWLKGTDPIVVDIPPAVRIEAYDVVAGAFTFPTPFVAAPAVDPVVTFTTDQLIVTTVTNITKTGCIVAVKRSRGTLLLTSGPFETAPATITGRIRVIGH